MNFDCGSFLVFKEYKEALKGILRLESGVETDGENVLQAG